MKNGYNIYTIIALLILFFAVKFLTEKDDNETVKQEVVKKQPIINGDGTLKEITEEEFTQLVADFKTDKRTYVGKVPAIVFIKANWCKYCREPEEWLKVLAELEDSRVLQFYLVDYDKCPNLIDAYGVRGVPSYIYCNDTEMWEIDQQQILWILSEFNPHVDYRLDPEGPLPFESIINGLPTLNKFYNSTEKQQ